MSVNPERLAAAKRRINEDKYDVDSWMLLLKNAQGRSVDEARETYESLVEIFPTCGRFWKNYIEHEMRMRNFERVEKLFQRCLMRVLSIDLWKTYLLYVKETKSSLSTYKEKMAQAYDFALDKMGLDIQSSSLWSEYINFLKGVEAQGSYAENQKIAAIRKVYQRAVITPQVNVEIIWKEYSAFEQSVNPMIAEKLTAERSRDYMTARRVTKENEAITRGLNKLAPSIPPSGTTEEAKQMELWNSFIKWEKSNPLKVEDPALVGRRVMFAYEQCLLCLGHHPDIWYEAAGYLQETSKTLQEKGDVDSARSFLEQASQMYERAVNGILKSCALLHFAYADFEEQNMNFDKVHSAYQKYLENTDIDPTLCYIQYMKFCRRAEGVKSARNVFKKAREDTRIQFHVYVAAALMEYYCSKDKQVAFKIFELGLKKFSNSTDFILAYLDYLSHLNEDNNTRVLFERVLTGGTLNPKDSLSIWNKFLEFESNIGDLTSIIKVEKRRAQVLVDSGLTNEDHKYTWQVIDRYRFMNLLPLTQSELGSLNYQDSYTKEGASAGLKGTSGGAITSSHSTAINGVENDNLARPDFSQMIPYKPKVNWRPGDSLVPGGAYPFPPAVSDLVAAIPPPNCFHGPFVIVEKLCEVFDKIRLPDKFQTSPNNPSDGGSYSLRMFDMARSVSWTVSTTSHGSSDGSWVGKRKAGIGGGEDSDEEGGGSMAPINDIYRKRQQKKMR